MSGVPFPSPGDLPDPGIEPVSPALQADSLLSESPRKPNKDNTKGENYRLIPPLKKRKNPSENSRKSSLKIY